MKTKFNLTVILSFWICSQAFSQDSTKTTKILYKIPASKVSTAESLAKTKLTAEEHKSVMSCAVNSITKEAIISTKLSNGTESKETFLIKEINK